VNVQQRRKGAVQHLGIDSLDQRFQTRQFIRTDVDVFSRLWREADEGRVSQHLQHLECELRQLVAKVIDRIDGIQALAGISFHQPL
jgi:hypothetical protein